jgi:hypothetical protein
MRLRTVAWIGLAAVGCQDPVAPEPLGSRVEVYVPDAAAVLASSEVSGTTLENNVVIADSADWAGAWARLFAGKFPPPPRPDVDFSRHQVLIALWIAGGSEVRVDSLVRFEQGARAYVTRRWGSGTGGLQMEVSLAEVVLAPRWPIVDGHTSTVP